jgi:Ni/Fe-hydrogenase subunit HybB-like protein
MLAKEARHGLALDPRAAWSALRVEVRNQPVALKAWFALLGGLMLLGVVGALVAIPPGDEVLGTSPAFEWGTLIAAYVFFVVTTSGLCLASSLGTVFGIELFLPLEKRHAILAVLFLVTGFIIIALDLHYPLRIAFGVAMSPSPYSPMWWMGVLYAIYLCFLLTEVWSMFRGHDRIHRASCVMSSVMAILAPSTLGAVFGVLASRPFWHGGLVPVYMLLTALLSGTAVLGIVFYFVTRFRLSGHGPAAVAVESALGLILAGVLALAMFLTAWQTIVGLYGGVPGLSEATKALVVGPLAGWFWFLKVGVGLLAPFLILAFSRTRTPGVVALASALAFVGIFADRICFVAGGQIAPTTTASGIVSYPYAAWVPSPAETAIVLGCVAFVAFWYTLAERYLDLSGHGIHAWRSRVAAGVPPETRSERAPAPGLALQPVPVQAMVVGPTPVPAPVTSVALAAAPPAAQSPAATMPAAPALAARPEGGAA